MISATWWPRPHPGIHVYSRELNITAADWPTLFAYVLHVNLTSRHSSFIPELLHMTAAEAAMLTLASVSQIETCHFFHIE